MLDTQCEWETTGGPAAPMAILIAVTAVPVDITEKIKAKDNSWE